MEVLAKKDHPPLLKEIPEPPEKLFIIGSLPPKDHIYLTVVGSRKYTSYARQAIKELVAGLRGYPISIVSGLAYGVDRLAHEAALENDLHTIAVPGSGLHESVLYPAQHKSLAKKIVAAGGALLSEFEPKTIGARWTFPKRNRIMAGMAPATLIVEATDRSGTLITSRLAADYNREVLTIPGSIFSKNTFGPHMLLRLGATPITKSEHLLEALNIPKKGKSKRKINFTTDEKKVMDILTEPRSREEIVQLLNMDAQHTNILLSMMELREYIVEYNGTFRSKL